jgi:hypothetical protein
MSRLKCCYHVEHCRSTLHRLNIRKRRNEQKVFKFSSFGSAVVSISDIHTGHWPSAVVSRHWQSRMSAGSKFHSRNAASGNARSPMVRRRVDGCRKVGEVAERRRRTTTASGGRRLVTASSCRDHQTPNYVRPTTTTTMNNEQL